MHVRSTSVALKITKIFFHSIKYDFIYQSKYQSKHEFFKRSRNYFVTIESDTKIIYKAT